MSAQTNERPWSAEIADNIAAESARRGMSAAALGRQLGISSAGMTDRRRYRQPWSTDEIQRVAEVLGVSRAALLGLEWASRGSNPEPMVSESVQVVDLVAWREGRAA